MSQLYTRPKNLQFIFMIACSCWIYLIPEVAHATLATTLGATICDLINMMKGMTGRSIATLAVMFLGVGTFFGKTNFALLITTTVGIGVLFGAEAIATTMGITVTTCLPTAYLATSMDAQIGEGLCKMATILTKDTGKALATMAVLFIGLASLFGKASWHMVITSVVGIGTMFGAAKIVREIATTSGWDGICLPSLVA